MPENVPIYAVVGIAIVAIVLIAAIAALVSTFFTVQQRTTALVQRLGKFVREAGPGLNVKVPFFEKVAGRINLRVQQLDVKIETKTEDNVFVQMVVAVQRPVAVNRSKRFNVNSLRHLLCKQLCKCAEGGRSNAEMLNGVSALSIGR